MATSHDRGIDVLNELAETCRDGEQGFRTAAEGVRDSQLKALFQTYAQQRQEFAIKLETEIRRLGGEPGRRGSVAGTLHRGWMNIRSALAGGDSAILAEAERGEDAAKSAYEKAVTEGLPEGARLVVERQYARVKEAHDRVRALREPAA
jgi:uncharacterized protein (TIGR02284 family)